MTKRDHYDVPVVSLPGQFKAAPAASDLKTDPAKPEKKLDPVLTQWWLVFGNHELDDLINRGLANNSDVRIATFRIEQSKIRAGQSIAGKGPTITAPLAASRQFPFYGVSGNPVESQGINVSGPNGNTIQPLFQAGLRADWRVDLWGELDSLAQSANLQLWRASFERDNVQGNVAAAIATSYIEYLSFNDRVHVAHETEEELDGMMKAVEDRMVTGDATAIDLEQQKASVYQVRATIPAMEQQRDDALSNIAFLLGTVPESLTLSDKGLDSLHLPSVIPGVPSSLLLRRPDVRMVEARLLAADADIDVARARVLPPLNLTAQTGYGSYYLSQLFQPQAMFWSIMANMTATIFDGGKLSKEKDYARAVHEEMVETYIHTIYQAVREVDVSLNAIRQTGKRLEAQKKSADAAHNAWNLNKEVYAVGLNDNLVLMDSERTYHQNLDEYDRIRMDRYKALVNLFHALGGGVPQGEVIPGRGLRPRQIPEDGIVLNAAPEAVIAEAKVSWASDSSYGKGWLVELPGLYHRKTINAAILDLKARFPEQMENHTLLRIPKGLIDNSVEVADKKLSWYQLYIAKFPTAAAAQTLCAELQESHQRCRVVSSANGKLDDTNFPILHLDKQLPVDVKPVSPVQSASRPNEHIVPVKPVEPAAIQQPSVTVTDNQQLTSPDIKRTTADVTAVTEAADNTRQTELKKSKETSLYTVQIDTYRYASKALRQSAVWQTRNYDAYVRAYQRNSGHTWYKILAGQFSSHEEADALAKDIKQKYAVNNLVVMVPTDAEGKPDSIIDAKSLTEVK